MKRFGRSRGGIVRPLSFNERQDRWIDEQAMKSRQEHQAQKDGAAKARVAGVPLLVHGKGTEWETVRGLSLDEPNTLIEHHFGFSAPKPLGFMHFCRWGFGRKAGRWTLENCTPEIKDALVKVLKELKKAKRQWRIQKAKDAIEKELADHRHRAWQRST